MKRRLAKKIAKTVQANGIRPAYDASQIHRAKGRYGHQTHVMLGTQSVTFWTPSAEMSATLHAKVAAAQVAFTVSATNASSTLTMAAPADPDPDAPFIMREKPMFTDPATGVLHMVAVPVGRMARTGTGTKPVTAMPRTQADLEALTDMQLRELAKAFPIQVPASAEKADVVSAILPFLVPPSGGQ